MLRRPRIVVTGDEEVASALVQRASVELFIMRGLMGYQGLSIMDRRVDFDDGSFISLSRNHGEETVFIYGAPAAGVEKKEEELFYGPLVYIAITHPGRTGRCIVWDPVAGKTADDSVGVSFPCDVDDLSDWMVMYESANTPLFKPEVAGNIADWPDLAPSLGSLGLSEPCCPLASFNGGQANYDHEFESDVNDADGTPLENVYSYTVDIGCHGIESDCCYAEQSATHEYSQNGRSRRWYGGYFVPALMYKRYPGLGTYALTPRNYEEGEVPPTTSLRDKRTCVYDHDSRCVYSEVWPWPEECLDSLAWYPYEANDFRETVRIATPIGELEGVEYRDFQSASENWNDFSCVSEHTDVRVPMEEIRHVDMGVIYESADFPSPEDVEMFHGYYIAAPVTDDHPERTCTGDEFAPDPEPIFWIGTDWLRTSDEGCGGTSLRACFQEACCRACFYGESCGCPVMVQIYFHYCVQEERTGPWTGSFCARTIYGGCDTAEEWVVTGRRRVLRIAANITATDPTNRDPRQFARDGVLEAAIRNLIEDFENVNGIGDDDFARFRTTVKILNRKEV
jgi:hypothetical protein